MQTVHVKLLDEGTDVWRPVDAVRIGDCIYRLIGEQVEDETWEFVTGSVVRVAPRQSGSEEILVAVEAASE